MTLPEAQIKFTSISLRLTPNLSDDASQQLISELTGLQDDLPNEAAFDPLNADIRALKSKLRGQITEAAIAELQSRTAALNSATALLSQTAADAAADARMLTFEKPQLIVATLKNAVTTVQEIRTAAQTGNYPQALEKIQALEALLAHAQTTIKD